METGTTTYLKELGSGTFATVMLNSQGDAVKISQNDGLFTPSRETLMEVSISSVPLETDEKSYVLRSKNHLVTEKDTLIIYPLAKMDLSKYQGTDKRRILFQVALGLAELHNMGVVHMDLKPANILLVEENNTELTPLIADFGLSNWYCADNTTWSGSYNYASPEALDDSRVSGPPADVWSYGEVMFDFLTGKSLFAKQEDFLLSARKFIEWLRSKDQRDLSSLYLDVVTLKLNRGLKQELEANLPSDAASLLLKIFTEENTRLDIFQVIQDPYFDQVRDKVEIPQDIKESLTCNEITAINSPYHIYADAIYRWGGEDNRREAFSVFYEDNTLIRVEDVTVLEFLTTVDIMDRSMKEEWRNDAKRYINIAYDFVVRLLGGYRSLVMVMDERYLVDFVTTTNLDFRPYTLFNAAMSSSPLRDNMRVLDLALNPEYPIWSAEERLEEYSL